MMDDAYSTLGSDPHDHEAELERVEFAISEVAPSMSDVADSLNNIIMATDHIPELEDFTKMIRKSFIEFRDAQKELDVRKGARS